MNIKKHGKTEVVKYALYDKSVKQWVSEGYDDATHEVQRALLHNDEATARKNADELDVEYETAGRYRVVPVVITAYYNAIDEVL